MTLVASMKCMDGLILAADTEEATYESPALKTTAEKLRVLYTPIINPSANECHSIRSNRIAKRLSSRAQRRISSTTNSALRLNSPPQICSGSSGSGSRTGASGFSIGEGGSLIGGGIGSAGVRRKNGSSGGAPNSV